MYSLRFEINSQPLWNIKSGCVKHGFGELIAEKIAPTVMMIDFVCKEKLEIVKQKENEM